MADIERTVITSAQAPQPLGANSLGTSVRPRKLVYLAGQVSVDADGQGRCRSPDPAGFAELGSRIIRSRCRFQQHCRVHHLRSWPVFHPGIYQRAQRGLPGDISEWRFPSRYPLNSRRIGQQGFTGCHQRRGRPPLTHNSNSVPKRLGEIVWQMKNDW